MKSVLFALAFAASVAAHAQSMTEFFHQPAAGNSEVTPHVGYRTATVRGSAPGSTEATISGLDRLGVKYEYGINPLIGLGVDLSYSSYKVSNNGPDYKGIEPLAIVLDGQLPMEMGSFQYGIGASFGLEKAKAETSSANRSVGDQLGDFPAGGFKLTPYLGYVLGLGTAGNAGAKVSYEIVNSDTTVETGGTDFKAGGGSQGQAALFYEGKAADVTLGAALTYDWFTRVWSNASGSEQTILGPRSLIGVKLYADMPFGTGIDFLPTLTWREKASSDDLDKSSDIHFTVAGRFTF